jgi:hypothetical protein
MIFVAKNRSGCESALPTQSTELPTRKSRILTLFANWWVVHYCSTKVLPLTNVSSCRFDDTETILLLPKSSLSVGCMTQLVDTLFKMLR